MNGRGLDNFKEEYSQYTFRKILVILVCIVLAVLFFFYSLTVGTLDLSMGRVYQLFIDHLAGVTYDRTLEWDDWYDDNVVWNYRVPRALLGLLAGMTLAIAGTTMQSVMKNPLADPYTTGVSSGALFGVAVAVVLGWSTGMGSGESVATFNAIVFSMVPVVIMIILSPFFRESPSSLILSGIAVSYLFSSLTTLLLVITDEETLASIYSWQVGSLIDRNWDSVYPVFLSTVLGLVVLLPLSNKMNLMSLSDAEAKALGMNCARLRIVCLVVLALITAVTVSYLGVIAFVGLVIPHISRLILGSDNKFLIPASAAIGAVFLLGCDIISRLIPVSSLVPVGVVSSFIGAPIFLYLIIRQKRSMW